MLEKRLKGLRLALTLIIIGAFVSCVVLLVIAQNKGKEKSTGAIAEMQESQKADIAEIKSRAATIKTPQDFADLDELLSEIGGDDPASTEFLVVEKVIVDRVAGLVDVGNYDQMRAFVENSGFVSTRNLLVKAFFEKGKLSNSKKDIVFGAELTFCGYGDSLNRQETREFLLSKAVESPDAFSTVELLCILEKLAARRERAAAFLDLYIGKVRKTKTTTIISEF